MYGSTMRSSPPQLFRGIRFVLLGFDPIKKSQVSRKLVQGGGIDAGQYDPNCTHVIVDKLVFDDPLCVAARQDGKILVSSLWVDHSFDVGAPVDTTSVMYTPVKDLNGIPGAKSLIICLTGYQREDREDIMTMVELMGAQVSKPLIANRVTHLICYKFEGEKYVLAKKMKRIKLINHRWLEDCLKAWKILPEEDYNKSGYELEMEAEAKDSEDEPEGVTTRHNEEKLTSPHHSLLSKQEIPNTISNTSASNLFSNAQETESVTMKTKSGQSPNPSEIKVNQQVTENLVSVTSEPSNRYGKTLRSSPAQNNLISASISANKSPQTEARRVISASYSMKEPNRTTPSKIDMKSNTSSAKTLNKLNFSDAFNMSSSLVQKATPYDSPAFRTEDEQNDVSSNKKFDISGGSFKPQQISQNNDVESPFQEVNKYPPIEMPPAQTPPSNSYGRKSLSSKGKNVILDVPVSRTSTSEIEDLNAVQRPHEEYNKTSLSTKSNNKDVDMSENAMHSPSAVSSDLQKSTLNSEINEQSAGSNSKPVRKKSISKKLSGSKLTKKNTVNQKGSIFLKNTDPGIDDENLFKYQQSKKVSPVAKSGAEMKTGVVCGRQVDNMSENKALCIDDETEPPDDEDEANKEKHENGEPENTADVLMQEKTEGNVDTGDLASEILLTKKGKKNTARSMKEVTDKKSVKKNELVIDNDFEKQEIREESTPNRAKRARKNINDLERSMEMKRAGVCNDLERNNDVNADMDIENAVNKKETNRNKRSLGKAIVDVCKRYGSNLEKSVEAKKSGVCNDPERNNGEKGDDVNADMDIGNAVNEKETTRNKRSLSKAKKDVSKRNGTDLEKSVEVKKSGVSNDHEHNNDEKGDDVDADIDEENVVNKKETNRNKRSLNKANSGDKGDDVDADMDIENVVNKKETNKNKRSLSKTKKDVSKRSGTDMEKSVEVKKSGVSNDHEHNNDEKGDDVDADIDEENVVNKKETNRNKRSLNKAKKDVSKRNRIDLEKSVEVKKTGVSNDFEHNHDEKGDDVDPDMDVENAVNTKETNRNNRSLSKAKKDTSKRKGTDLEKSVGVKKSGVSNVPEHNDDEKGDDVDADMENQNAVNKNETTRNKRSLSKTKKVVTKRNATDLEKSVDVDRVEGVANDPEHNNDKKDDDVDAHMDVENAVNEKETEKNKRPPSKAKKEASKRKVSNLEKSVEVKDNDGADNDADMDTGNVLNKKETKSNKRPLSRTKKDATKAVNKKGKPTSNHAVETCDVEEAQKENVHIHVNDQSTGDKHVFKPAKEVAEKNTDKGDSKVLKDEPMWFILTGHRLQRKEFQQIIKRLKGRVCRVAHNWSYQATHFIVPDPIRRTEKFFAAAASGRWILKTDYLSASNQAGKFVAEEPYEWHKNGLSEDGQINLEAPRKWRLLKEKTGHGAFYGMKIVVYGECIVPPLDTLKRAVKAGDGTILATSPPYTRFLNTGIDFAVVSPGMPYVDMWVQEFLKHEIPCVSADYLVEYVCKPGYPLEKHVQYGTNAWAERSYNNLQNRYLTDTSEPGTPESNDVACEVCGSRDRGEEMLICGDEGGSIGCGVGTHIDCCDPPFESIPEEDWFCCKCSKSNKKNKKGGKNKGK